MTLPIRSGSCRMIVTTLLAEAIGMLTLCALALAGP